MVSDEEGVPGIDSVLGVPDAEKKATLQDVAEFGPGVRSRFSGVIKLYDSGDESRPRRDIPKHHHWVLSPGLQQFLSVLMRKGALCDGPTRESVEGVPFRVRLALHGPLNIRVRRSNSFDVQPQGSAHLFEGDWAASLSSFDRDDGCFAEHGSLGEFTDRQTRVEAMRFQQRTQLLGRHRLQKLLQISFGIHSVVRGFHLG